MLLLQEGVCLGAGTSPCPGRALGEQSHVYIIQGAGELLVIVSQLQASLGTQQAPNICLWNSIVLTREDASIEQHRVRVPGSKCGLCAPHPLLWDPDRVSPSPLPPLELKVITYRMTLMYKQPLILFCLLLTVLLTGQL